MDLGNTSSGVYTTQCNNCTMGGTTAQSRNVFSGNGRCGLSYWHSDGTLIQGNYMGTDAAGVTPLGNSYVGMEICHGTGNTTGGPAVGAANLVAYNADTGVELCYYNSTDNRVSRNSIHHNGAGIDIYPEHGPNPNDPGDLDSGLANRGQNWPEIRATSLGSLCPAGAVRQRHDAHRPGEWDGGPGQPHGERAHAGGDDDLSHVRH
jgi:hypothetical protein